MVEGEDAVVVAEEEGVDAAHHAGGGEEEAQMVARPRSITAMRPGRRATPPPTMMRGRGGRAWKRRRSFLTKV